MGRITRQERPALGNPAGKKSQKPKVLVGESWPEGIEVQVDEHPSLQEQKVRLGINLVSLFGILLVLFTFYAMATADQGLLRTIFQLVQDGLIFAFGWVLRRSS